jgi:acyl carrier protein/NADP-dependent 3-hydroxy acid dehydrogenase YdfG
MANAKHIGKIILRLLDKDIKIAPAKVTAIRFKEDAAYLITGGFGGFGLLVAGWMVRNGARHLALMGRSGAASSEAQKQVKKMRKSGAQIIEIRGDVAEKQDIQKALWTIKSSMPPLRGIFHAAMILDDALLLNLSPKRMTRVLSPKIKGAWNLHRQSLDLALDFFVFFSSVSSLIGMPGQGNYVTANAFLDGLSFYRRSKNLPSMTINWGFLGKVGIAARNKETAARFENQGLRSFTPGQALEILSRLLEFNPVHMAVINMDWARFGKIFTRYSRSPKFSGLWEEEIEKSDEESQAKMGGDSIRKRLFTVTEKEKTVLLVSALRDQIAKVLGTSPDKLDPDKPLTELGFDSLMAVELRNWVENNLGISLPTIEVMRGPSLNTLAQKLIKGLSEQSLTEPASAIQPGKQKTQPKAAHKISPKQILESIDELSDDEVDSLLQQMISRDQ